MNRTNTVLARIHETEMALVDALKDQLHLASRSDVLRQGIYALREKHPQPVVAKKKSAGRTLDTR